MKTLLLAVTLGFSAGCAAPHALVAAHKAVFKTQAPVHVPICPDKLSDTPFWRNIHPECRRYTAWVE